MCMCIYIYMYIATVQQLMSRLVQLERHSYSNYQLRAKRRKVRFSRTRHLEELARISWYSEP